MIGKTQVNVSFQGRQVTAEFFVVKGVSESLLSFSTAKELRLIDINVAYNVKTSVSVEDVVDSYSDRFEGLGKLTDAKCKLHVDENVQPVAQPHRRIPFQVRKKVEAELERLQKLDVIERVSDTPTPWVSPITVVKKPKSKDEIRLCIDMRAPNQAIQRERHVTPTLDDILASLNGSTVFSKLDLKNGYHQVELDEDSRFLTVFSAHNGLWRFKRLNFGVNSAAEQFQNLIQSALAGLPGVINISDDILVFGKDPEEHKERLRNCLQRLREKNLTVNRKKCEFSKSSIGFFGHVFSSEGLSPSPDKVEALQDAAPPANKEEVRSLLGLATYCARFIPRLATITDPLRTLTKTDTEWIWEDQHDLALQEIKDSISEHCKMAYFNPQLKTEVVVDASPVGLCAMLVQHNDTTSFLVALASRSLSDVEQRYSQTEREALAVTWGIQHFHMYLYGGSFEVATDHKPLLPIFNKPTAKPPLRIERWLMRLQEYDFKLTYQPGKTNPADYMSRHPLASTKSASREQKMAEEYVNLITSNAVPRSLSLDEIEHETQNDGALQECMRAIKHNKWHDVQKTATGVIKNDIDSLYKVRNELSINADKNILLRDHRIVIPKALRQRAIDIAHEGHQGVIKTKQLMRLKVWFPGLDRMVEQTVASCLPCQASTVERNTAQEVKMSDLPAGPWQEVSIDFKELPTGEYLMVVIDDYSRFPVIEIIRSTSAKTVVPRLDTIFAAYGIPVTVRSDNGPPFNSHEFKQFAGYSGFEHRKVTPLWPQANGEVERMMRNLKKLYRTATTEHQSTRQALNKYLRNYRATPHSSTGVAPATLLFGRETRVRLPELPRNPKPDKSVRKHDKKAKDKMKSNAEKNKKLSQKQLRTGDCVLLKRDKSLKTHQTPYHTNPYEVTQVKGTMITATDGTRTVTRNASYFKKVEHLKNSKDVKPQVELDSDDYFTADEQDPDQAPRQPAPVPARPQRNRRLPARLQDYVL